MMTGHTNVFRLGLRYLRSEGVLKTLKASLGLYAIGKRLILERLDDFDREYHVETTALVAVADLAAVGSNSRHSKIYMPLLSKDFRETFDGLDIAHEEYSFIDLGCGKGRALFLASEYPFRKIIGIEFSKTLFEVLSKNLKTFKARAQRCRNIEILLGDVCDYEFPDEKAIIYLFNPFDDEVMIKTLKNIQTSLARVSRDILIVYFNPEHEGVICAHGFEKISKPSNRKSDLENTCSFFRARPAF